MPRPIPRAGPLQPRPAAYAPIRGAGPHSGELAVDLVMNWGHVFALYGDSERAHVQCWTVRAARAEQAERLVLGIGGGWFEKDDDAGTGLGPVGTGRAGLRPRRPDRAARLA